MKAGGAPLPRAARHRLVAASAACTMAIGALAVPRRECDRPQAPAGAGAGPDQVGGARPRGLEPAAAEAPPRGSRRPRQAVRRPGRAEGCAREAGKPPRSGTVRCRPGSRRRSPGSRTPRPTWPRASSGWRTSACRSPAPSPPSSRKETPSCWRSLVARRPDAGRPRHAPRGPQRHRRPGDPAYDDLHAAEVLQVRENEVQAAKDDVAAQRRAAAAHLVTMRELFRETRREGQGPSSWSTTPGRGPPGGPRPGTRQCRPRPAARAGEQDQGADPRWRPPAAARNPGGGYRGETGGFLGSPVNGSVTSPFGYRVRPIYYRAMHNGTDFGAGCGQPVYAVNAGTVMTSTTPPATGTPLPQPRHGQRQEPPCDLQPPLRLRRGHRSAGRPGRSSDTSATPAGPPATSTSR